MECILCCEPSIFMTVGHCNHRVVCLKCCFKMRHFNKSIKCVYCNVELDEVAVIDEEISFDDVYPNMNIFKFGLFPTNGRTKGACYHLLKYNCPVKNCQEKNFSNKNMYKKHLENSHKRFICELCEKNNTLLLDEQKIFRAHELDLHLDNGDFANDNLILLHPYCEFCDERFFNDEDFLSHLRKKHEKCFLCKHPKFKFTYYKNYPSLDKHFSQSHYACPKENCKVKGFIVFKKRAEIMKHLKVVHKTGDFSILNQNILESIPEDNEDKLFDKEGFNISYALLSEVKNEDNVINEKKQETMYNNKIDIKLLFNHLINQAYLRPDEERNIIFEWKKKKNPRKNSKKNNYYDRYSFDEEDIYVEIIKFKLLNSKTFYTQRDFVDDISEILNFKTVGAVKKITYNYFKGDMSAEELFDKFSDIFSPILAFKYFYLYSFTSKKHQFRFNLIRYLDSRISKLYFKNASFILTIKNWKEFFHKYVSEISKNIIQRIESKKLKLSSTYKWTNDRLYQLIGCVKKLDIFNAIDFKFYGNFIFENNNIDMMKNLMTVNQLRIQNVLNRISNMDILISFLYFNLITLRFEDREKITNAKKVNPNLTKLFLRHFPQIAQDEKYNLASGDEDYNMNIVFNNKEEQGIEVDSNVDSSKKSKYTDV